MEDCPSPPPRFLSGDGGEEGSRSGSGRPWRAAAQAAGGGSPNSGASATPVPAGWDRRAGGGGTPGTPLECESMVNAVEAAITQGAGAAPGTPGAASAPDCPQFCAWLESSGLALPTPAAKDLQRLAQAAADNARLKRQLEALREAELELAAHEAEEHAHSFAVLEGENLTLAGENARLQEQLAELQAQRQAAGGQEGGVQGRAQAALLRAADARRQFGACEERQLASFKDLDQAEEQLSAAKERCHGGGPLAQQRLQQAEADVAAAAQAAREASQQLQLVLEEKGAVQRELAAIRQQLEAQPAAQQQHAELHRQLMEAQQALQEERERHQRLASCLLEHAGRLSHKYHSLSDDHGALQQRYDRLSSANEHLASQLREAHEAVYELQAAVQATPPAKRREQQHLLRRARDAEAALRGLQQDRSALQRRLEQAQAFIAALKQRGSGAGSGAAAAHAGAGADETPTAGAAPASCAGSTPAMARAGAPAAGGGVEFGGIVTPVKEGRAGGPPAPRGLPQTPAGSEQPVGAGVGGQPAARGPSPEPVSPILEAAAAALSACAGQQERQQLQWRAASHELRHVQQEQLGLREEICRARSALADIAGQLRAGVGPPGRAARPAASAAAARTAPGGAAHKAASAPVAGHGRSPSPAGCSASSSCSGGAGGSAPRAHRRPVDDGAAPAASACPQAAAAPQAAGAASALGGGRAEAAPCGAGSASSGSRAQGSLSLDQLIADAESVSLEYDQGCPAQQQGQGQLPLGGRRPPGARGGAAAGPAQQRGRAHETPACSAVGSSGAGGCGDSEEDEAGRTGAGEAGRARQRPAERLPQTPGPASSSVGATEAAAVVARLWLQQQALQGAQTPPPGTSAADAGSAARPRAPGSGGSGASLALAATPAAPTPTGLERVASNEPPAAEATPVAATPLAPPGSPRGAVSGGERTSPLQAAAAALLASISPAGLLSPGEVVPLQALQRMTPEWMRELRQRCQQGTLEVQQLRRELGLATPDAAPGIGPAATAASAAAATGPESPRAADAWRPGGGSSRPGELAAPTPAPAPLAGGSSCGAPGGAAAPTCAPHGSLSQASCRSNIDRLRRRAIAQAAAAAAAADGPDADGAGLGCGGAAATPAEPPGSVDGLERAESGGSLAGYMQLAATASRGGGGPSRTASGQLPSRPDCPTPGSAFSCTPGDSSPVCGSPDALLAGIRSSRALARELQERLQHQLGRTASLPEPAARPLGGGGSSSGGQRAPLHARGLHEAGEQPGELAEEEAAGGGREPPHHPGEAAAPGASPVTPGAALNAGAESRLLSPGAQLVLFFDEDGAAQQRQSQQVDESREEEEARGRGGWQQPGSPNEGARPAGSGGSSSASLLTDAALSQAAEPSGGCPAAVPSPPSSSMAARSPQAHPLGSLEPGTIVSFSIAHGASALGRMLASDASQGGSGRGAPPLSGEASSAAAHAALSAPRGGASGEATAAAVSESSEVDPSLSSWVRGGSVAGAASTAGGDSSAGAIVVSTSGRSRPPSMGRPAHEAVSCGARPPPEHIWLGDSPTSSQAAGSSGRGHRQSSSGTPVAACSSSCSSGPEGPGRVSLGASPDSPASRAVRPAPGLQQPPAQGLGGGEEPGTLTDAAAAAPDAGSPTGAAAAAATAPGGRACGAPAAAAAASGSSAATTRTASCVFATPAAAFGTSAAAGDSAGGGAPSDQVAFFTGLPHTARSAHSPSAGTRRLGGSPAAANGTPGGAGASPPGARDSPEGSLLQQLLASPGSTCSPSGAGSSSAWGPGGAGGAGAPSAATQASCAAGHEQEGAPHGARACDDPGSCCTHGSNMPEALGASALQQHHHQRQQCPPAADSRDVSGLSFEQRLALLCSDGEEEGGACVVARTPALPAHLACCATQTTPAAATTKRAGAHMQDAQTQVTPASALQRSPLVQPPSAAQHKCPQQLQPHRCDLLRSPSKARDQRPSA